MVFFIVVLASLSYIHVLHRNDKTTKTKWITCILILSCVKVAPFVECTFTSEVKGLFI